ncbi:esterase E4-like [Sipha flava]|nr:esterase E4-like [Sipha flava]
MVVITWISIACLSTVCWCCCSANSSPRVNVESGELSGLVDYTHISGRPFYSFLGVPYASPPVHENRFKEAQPVKPWVGIWNATIPGSDCLGFDHSKFKVVGQEDCLYLNVYTPTLPQEGSTSGGSMNVIVYIHGGAFQFGSGIGYTPHYLLDGNDLVFVSINYRLGPLGFASTGDDTLPGNNGLKDQVAALKWVQRNIGAFGGNPEAVTIAGMSAGGASVHYHMLSPMSLGLFNRAIAESGSAFCHWAYAENVVSKTTQLAESLGCPTYCPAAIIKCLRSRPAMAIVQSLENFMPWKYNPFTVFGPTIEPEGENRFLTNLPENLSAQDVPSLFSYTQDDGLYPSAEFVTLEETLVEMESKWDKIIPFVLDYNNTISDESLRPEIAKKIKSFYFGNNPVSLRTKNNIIEMTSDRMFKEPTARTAKHLASKSSSPVYFYEFAYRAKDSLSDKYSKTGNSEGLGVSHGDDTMFVVRTTYGNPHANVEDAKLIPVMVNMWTSFVKTGVPDLGSSVVWSPVSKNPDDPLKLIKITQAQTFEPQELADPGNHTFWSTLPLTEFTADGLLGNRVNRVEL